MNETALDQTMSQPNRKQPTNNKAQSRFLLLVLCGVAVLALWRVAFPFRSSVDWQTDFPAALAQAAADDKQVLINFTARDCAYCTQMEVEVFPTKPVQAAMSEFVPVKIDVYKDEMTAARYNITAMPTYVVTDATGAVLAMTSGFQPPDKFSAFLERASVRAGK